MKTQNRIKILLICTLLLCISLGSVSAADTGNNTTTNTTGVSANFTNPGFESGNLTGWTTGSTTTITTNSHNGNYGAYFSSVADQNTNYITQTVNLTDANNITFWGCREGGNGALNPLYVYIDDTLIQTIIPTSTWTQYAISTSSYTGFHNITIAWYGNLYAGHYGFDIDDFSINAPIANFTSNTTQGTAPLTIQFNDTSTDTPTSWLWNFGDGTTSTKQNPTHTYTTPGIYTVTLTATNEADNNKISDNGQITKTNYITVMDSTTPIVVANNNTGSYNTILNIILTTIDSYGATTTYYTTDGTDPKTSNTRNSYNGPITITNTTTLRYAAINSKDIWSPEYTQNYTLDFIAPIVTSNLNNGTYTTTQTVTLTTTDPNSKDTTYYTTDGTDPRTSTTRNTYNGPVTINTTTTLRYAAIDPAGNWSPLYIQNYVIGNGTVANSAQSNYTGPQTNTVKWIYSNLYGSLDKGIAVGSDGTIYMGTIDASIKDGYLYAFYSNGTLKWKYYLTGGIMSSPTIGENGTIYVGSYYGVVYAFNPDGTVKWTLDLYKDYNATTGRTIYSSPAIGADGTIYIATCNGGSLYAISPDGTPKWKCIISNVDAYNSPVIGSDGTIYLGADNQKFYALNPDGTIKWTYQLNTKSSSSAAIGSDGTIYVGDTDGNLYALNPNGTLKWTYKVLYEVRGIEIASDGTIYFGTSNAYSALYALNPNGTLKWNYTAGHIFGVSIGADGTIYFGTDLNSCIYALNSNGTTKWTYNLGYGVASGVLSTPIITSNGTLYILTCPGVLYAFEDPVDTTAPTAGASLNGGNYYSSKTVALTTTESATIYYTLTGANPTTSSMKYTGAISLTTSKTLKFFAVDAAGNTSPIYTQRYNIYKLVKYTYKVNVKWKKVWAKVKWKKVRGKWRYHWVKVWKYKTVTRTGTKWVQT